MLVEVLIVFVGLCAVSVYGDCDEWHKVQVAVNDWDGDLNVLTGLSHNEVNLNLLFGESNETQVIDRLNISNDSMDIQILADYDEYGNPILRNIVINGVNICEKPGGRISEFKHPKTQLQFTTPPTPPPPTLTPTYTIAEECGIVIPEVIPYIHYGNEATASEFPWHAVLFDMPYNQYRCGGTLIFNNVVVIAAHCVTESQSNYPLPPNSLFVILGKDHLKTDSIVEQKSNISEIHVHPDFDPNTFNNDIAVLKLQSKMRYTNFVRPACIWPKNYDRIDSIVDMYGSVPGFGFNEHWNLPDQLASVKMPVVSYETCLSSHRDFYARVISETNFCAGSLNGSSVCNGDSGGGMVFKINSLFYLRGIVSIGPSSTEDRSRCNTKYYIVFTDVAKYVDWLRQFSYKYT